jgi:hypothetical protein
MEWGTVPVGAFRFSKFVDTFIIYVARLAHAEIRSCGEAEEELSDRKYVDQ